MALLRESLEQEIERLRRIHLHLLAEVAEGIEAPCLWDLDESCLHWRVFLADVLEPDLDVEVLDREVIVVRGQAEPQRMRQALVLVPAPFSASRARIRFEAGVLEIRLTVVR